MPGFYQPSAFMHSPKGPMFEQAFKNIDNVLRTESGAQTELDYTEQISWLLFLKYLDSLEQDRATQAKIEGKPTANDHELGERWLREFQEPLRHKAFRRTSTQGLSPAIGALFSVLGAALQAFCKSRLQNSVYRVNSRPIRVCGVSANASSVQSAS